MNIIESLEWRYATKKFDATKTLTDAQIELLTNAFNLTATSYGLQPLKLLVIQNKTIQQELITHSWNQQQIVDASHVLVICIEEIIDNEYINAYFDRVKSIRNTPDEVLNPFKEHLLGDFSKKTTEETITWATKQAYIALGNLLTVCATEKIDACPMEGFIPKKYDEILNLKELNLKSVLVLPVGYRATDDMFSDMKKVRRPIPQTIIKF